MNTFPHLNAWLQCLMQLTPPRGLVHICTGVGAGQPFPFTSMPRVLAVAADALRHSWLQTQLKNHSQSHLVHAVVAGGQADVDYYTMSLGKESGLCPPELLQKLWPNIRLVRVDRRPTVTLQSILPQAPEDVEEFNWLVIDYLPAQDFLQSAGSLPGMWDVVVVRVLKNGNAIAGGQSVGLDAVRQYLTAYGLVLAAIEEENHPEIVHALFVRSPGQQIAQEKSKLIEENAELTRAGAELTAQRDSEARAKAEALAQRDALAQENSKLTAENAELTRAGAELTAQRDSEARAKAEALAQRDALAQENSKLTAEHAELTRAGAELAAQRDSEARAKAEALAQRDAVFREKDALINARDEQAKVAADRQGVIASQKQELTSIQQRIHQLEADNQENLARQQMMQEELIKAEAQIELIKDLLLREPGL